LLAAVKDTHGNLQALVLQRLHHKFNKSFAVKNPNMEDLNPLNNQLKDMKDRVQSLRGYL